MLETQNLTLPGIEIITVSGEILELNKNIKTVSPEYSIVCLYDSQLLADALVDTYNKCQSQKCAQARNKYHYSSFR